MKMCNTTVVNRAKTILFHYYRSKIQLIPTTHHINQTCIKFIQIYFFLNQCINVPSLWEKKEEEGSNVDIEANLILPISVPIPTRIGHFFLFLCLIEIHMPV